MGKLKNILINSSRRTKQLVVSLVDFLSIVIATIFAIYISDYTLNDINLEQFLRLIWLPIFAVLIFALTGVYRSIVRYIDFSFIYLLISSIIIVFVINLIIKTIFESTLNEILNFSNSVINFQGWIVGFLSSIVLLVGSRLVANSYFSDQMF